MSSYSLRCSVHSALTTAVAELAASGSTCLGIGGVAPWVAEEEALASGFAGAVLLGFGAGAGLAAGCAGAGAAAAATGAGAEASDFASGDEGAPNCSSRALIACRRGVRRSITFCRSSGSGSTRSRSRRSSPSLPLAWTSAASTSSNVARARSRVLLYLSIATVEVSSPWAAKANSARTRTARRRRNDMRKGRDSGWRRICAGLSDKSGERKAGTVGQAGVTTTASLKLAVP